MTTPRHLLVLQQLLPPVAYDPNGPELLVELTALAKALDAAEDAADVVLRAMDPAAVPALLPEWEAALGLPDSGDVGLVLSDAQRAAAVKAKLAQRATFSMTYLVQVAAALGYPGVTISRHRPATCMSLCTSPLWTAMHRSLLDVHVPAGYDGARLESVFRRLQPAHVLFRFFYGV